MDRRPPTVIISLALAACVAGPAVVHAQDARLDVQSGDTMKSLLDRHVGKRVTLVMQSGPDMTGVVVKVGDRVVLLGSLQGNDFSDAAVSLDRINAVVVRVRTK